MFSNYIKQSQELIDQGKPFVVALVVNYEAPISGKPGDRAIVTEEGELWGWVAGGCSQSIIIEEAQNVLKSGSPKMIQISPEPEVSNDKIIKHKMTCHSGGTLDVYLEPVIPKPQIVVLGSSVVAEKLTSLANALDYEVLTRLDITKLKHPHNTYVVVSTQGDGDEAALEKALAFNPGYLGFIASSKKAKAIGEILLGRGISAQQLKTIKAPAGLDIKARTPEEIALSIMAEIVMTLRGNSVGASNEEPSEKAIDPICGMSVKIDGAKYVFNHQDTHYYFCCEGCRTVFEQDPEKYLAKSG